MKKTTKKILGDIYNTLFNSQKKLSQDMEKILHDNRWELYESCDKDCVNKCEREVCELEKSSEILNNFADKLLSSTISTPPEFDKIVTENFWNMGAENSQKRGSFIVIDGPDGAGKSTVIEYLKNIIPELVTTRDPGGTLEGMEIRKLILSELSSLETFSIALGFLICRYETQSKIVLPNIEKGKIVISDRWDSSTFAIQQYTENLKNEVEVLNYKFIRPDYFILLDIDPEEGLKRSFKKAQELGLDELRFEKKGLEYAKTVREGFEVYKNLYYTENNSITISTENKSVPFICGQILMFLYKKGLL